MSKGKDLINSIKYGLYRMLTKEKAIPERFLKKRSLNLAEA